MIIVLVGPPSSGKTTILKKLQEKKFKVFHADSFINSQYKKNNAGYELIKSTFGKNFVNEKEVNKDLLKEKIASDNNFLMRLNETIHPLIQNYLEGKDNFIAELPIINSSPINFKYDKLVLVTANNETLLKRMKEKYGINNNQFLNFIIDKWDNNINYDLKIDTSNNIDLDLKINEIINLGINKNE